MSICLTIFPLGGGHGVSLHIQIISFQIWIELHGWKLYDNIISSLLHILRMSFIVHYQKLKEFWIKKYVAKIFLIFQAFFINLWSRGKHSWLWILRSRVQISVTPFLFHRENCWCHRDSNMGLQSPKSAMLALRPRKQIFPGKKILYVNLHGRRRNDHLPWEISWKITHGE